MGLNYGVSYFMNREFQATFYGLFQKLTRPFNTDLYLAFEY